MRTVHRINCIPYGPGPVDVTGEIACLLREAESRVTQYEERFGGEYAALIMGGRRAGTVRSQQVAPETFDAAWTSPGVVPVQSLSSPIAGG